ncbi:class I SAM-dependent methyltransferase [Desulfosoma caldarium]|uniref:Methyltransferase family protein n=1 Tax=Desulfosoma caldarium TaxID=610254 RepID=A0A3N1UQW4_9BACT|nr:class I SAM-dependent methyltransferase [Desulfosoma caldarium]ROQ92128.1 methyltransferase family protein [Desulfosoma caldarium]
MGYIFRLEDAQRMEQWAMTEPGRTVLRLERHLLQRLWNPPGPQRVLDVGCATGLTLRWLAHLGHAVTGVEPSWELVRHAQRNLPERIEVHHGFAEDLPFSDNEFDTVTLITTLEFVENPRAALAEACRVARRHVLIGTLNKWSLTGCYRRMEFLWKPSVYRHAAFLSVLSLKRLLQDVLYGSPVCHWRTCLVFPLWLTRQVEMLEDHPLFQYQPFGHFLAMRVDLRSVHRPVQEPLMEPVVGIGPSGTARSCWRLHGQGGRSTPSDAPGLGCAGHVTHTSPGIGQ